MLKPYAVSDVKSKGREYPEDPDRERGVFQKDRDRIIHCRSFRRLNLKTQVFVSGYGDHYRTRLTHTIEVAQISRDIARALGLNEDLAEAIALAHDLGHTPFGHAGEMAMDRCMQKFGKAFEHNDQSKRVVTKLEHVYPDFPGLNLSFEVLDGLSKHQTPWDNRGLTTVVAPSLEAQVVNVADEIAYSNHDIDDGLRAELIDWGELIEVPIVGEALQEVADKYGEIDDLRILRSRVVSGLMGLMISRLILDTSQGLDGIADLGDVYGRGEPLVAFLPDFAGKMSELKEFLQKNFYLNEKVLELSRKGEEILETLFDYYIQNLDEVPEYLRDEDDVIAVKDYVCGMTDVFARKKYAKIAV